MLLHAKNSQDKKLIKILVDEIRPKVVSLVKKYSIDGVLFIPPTIKREIQFMKELEKNLKLPIKTLSVTKVKTPVAVAQKTLSKLEDRIENARKTIVVEDSGIYKKTFFWLMTLSDLGQHLMRRRLKSEEGNCVEEKLSAWR